MKNTNLLRKWENVLSRVDNEGNQWRAKHSSRICSNHFMVSDYTTTKHGSPILKKDAVPTLAQSPTSELEGMAEPELKRHCLEQQQPLPEVPLSNIVMHDHTYAKDPHSSTPEPEPIQVRLVTPLKEAEGPNQYREKVLKHKIKSLQQKLRRQEKKATSMKELIDTVKEKLFVKEEEAEVLHNNFDNISLSLFQNALKNKNVQPNGRRYADQIKEFAVTLHFYSPKAYNFLRTIIPLPQPSLIKIWASSVDCEPGFITEAFDILKQEVQDHPEKKDCCLVFDAMAIRKQVLWDPKKDAYVGLVNYGVPETEIEPSNVMATEALVFALVGLRSHFKCPIAYFLIDKISAAVQAQLVRQALIKTAKIGLKVWCITSDGTTSNIATFKLLGCILHRLTYQSMITKFPHPTLGSDVFIMLDPCHMLKLARNALASLGSIHARNEAIHWKFFKNLVTVQENHGMKLANKLSSSHIKYEKNKMKVDLAAQTLSRSVADAIDFLNIVEKDPRFTNSEATVTFIRHVDYLFDVLNSRNPLGKGSK